MTTALAGALMRLAACSLGESRREWACAMEGEFQAAVEDGQALAFAAGCLIAAWREMPAHEEGRLALANHVFALGLLIPMAAFELGCVAGLPYLFGQAGVYSLLTPGSPQEPYLADAFHSAILPLLTLWLLLGTGHLRLAWALLDRDWAGVARIGALTVAASATLVIFTTVLFLNDAGVALQAMLLAMELSAIYVLARWHSRVFRNPAPPTPAW